MNCGINRGCFAKEGGLNIVLGVTGVCVFLDVYVVVNLYYQEIRTDLI